MTTGAPLEAHLRASSTGPNRRRRNRDGTRRALGTGLVVASSSFAYAAWLLLCSGGSIGVLDPWRPTDFSAPSRRPECGCDGAGCACDARPGATATAGHAILAPPSIASSRLGRRRMGRADATAADDGSDSRCAYPGTPECEQIKTCVANHLALSGCDGILRRKAVFDDLRRLVSEREAFAPHSTLPLNWDADSAALEPLFVRADTDFKYFRALFMLNNARRDCHLALKDAGGPWVDASKVEKSKAPIRFLADFAEPVGSYAFFVVGYDAAGLDAVGGLPTVGDRLVSVNGVPIRSVVRQLELYYQSSSYYQSMWRAQEGLETWSALYDEESFLGDPTKGITYELQRADGSIYTLRGQYRQSYTYNNRPIVKSGGAPSGFMEKPVVEKENFSLYLHGGDAEVLYLEWLGLQGDVEGQMGDLVEYAAKKGILGFDLIIDTTTARRGGSNGVLASRRLCDKSFLATFGNVRVSDASMRFALGRNMSWLEKDIAEATNNGAEYTRSRPFKLANFDEGSDGTLSPMPPHFSGRTVWLVHPSSVGSHIDQLVAMAIDNRMGHSIGVASPGYSNTWEWEETYKDPTSGSDLIGWMWNIGHTIRPNGEVLQGNPAVAVEQVAMTPDNYDAYFADLVQRAMNHLGH